MAIRAIIMAGGEGVRLRPLTDHLPKPLVPLMGKPVMHYTLQLLKKHGIEDVGVTLWYLPKMIRAAFGTGEKEGVRLTYYEEVEPLGTAGSVCMAGRDAADTFFVLSGDGLIDCDLKKALAFHQRKKALATLVLKRVEVPLSYGVVLTDKEGRIQRFLEKPEWENACSNLVNTGLYILDKSLLKTIAKNKWMDFGKDVFPQLLKKGERLYGYETEGYWCDVGNRKSYLQAQQDLMAGNVQLESPAGIHPEAKVAENVHFQGNFLVGKGTVIQKGAVIRQSVIGEGCRIGSGAVIENSCIWDRCFVGEKARIAKSIVCDEAVVKGGASLSSGCVLGQGAQVGSHAKLYEHAVVLAGEHIAPGAVCRENMGQTGPLFWDETGAVCLRSEEACLLADAFVQLMQPERMIVAGADSGLGAVTAGALCQRGVHVTQMRGTTEAVFREAVIALQADGGVLVQGDRLVFADERGEMPDGILRRKMENILLSGKRQAVSDGGTMGKIMDGAEEMYLARLVKKDKEQPLLLPVAVFCRNEKILQLAADGLKRMNVCRLRLIKADEGPIRKGETGFLLDRDGREVQCIYEGAPIEKTQLTMLRLKKMADERGVLYEGEDVPRAACGLAPLRAEDKSEICLAQARRLKDGVSAIFDVCFLMKKGELKAGLQSLPAVHRICREVECPESEKSRILYELWQRNSMPYTLNRGMQVQHKGGCASIVPHPVRPSVRIFAEAVNMEAAGELCDFYRTEIERSLQKNMPE